MSLIEIDFMMPPRQAMLAARARGVKLAPEFYGLEPEKRIEAFTVSGLSALDQVQSVLDELHRTLGEGGTFADFKRWARNAKLELPPGRLETVFRTGVQQAYNAGHWKRFEQDAEDRPYLMYDAINDSRTRPAHRALDGVIRPAGDDFWRTHSPALGFNCRCRLISLSPDQARARGGVTQSPPAEGQPDGPGWGQKPLQRLPAMDRVVESRQSACVIGARPGRRAPAQNIDCSRGGSAFLGQLGAPPAAKRAAIPILPERTSEDGMSHLAPFLRALGGEAGDRAVDVKAPDGTVLGISADLFINRARGTSKMSKQGRHRYLLFLADTIAAPQEMWRHLDELRLMSRYVVGRTEIGVVAIFKRQRGRWVGVGGYETRRDLHFRGLRIGRRVYVAP